MSVLFELQLDAFCFLVLLFGFLLIAVWTCCGVPSLHSIAWEQVSACLDGWRVHGCPC